MPPPTTRVCVLSIDVVTYNQWTLIRVNCSFDTVVVGAGLAGACTAAELARHERVLLVDRMGPAAGASGVGAGLVNPLMARKGNPPWRVREALGVFNSMLEQTGMASSVKRGILRPAVDATQAIDFQRAARENPDLGRWIPPSNVASDPVSSPFGSLDVHAGIAVSIPEFVEGVVRLAEERGAETRFGWRLDAWRRPGNHLDGLNVTLQAVGHPLEDMPRETVTTRRVFLCVGNALMPPWCGDLMHGRLPRLNLHGIKGQSIRVVRPPDLPPIPALSGHGYIVDEGSSLFIGSTYEHTFSHMDPDPGIGDALLSRACKMLPALVGAPVLDRLAGCRATVPGTRLPMVGPFPGAPDIWVFTGLGSKGLLLAPLLAREIHHYFGNPEAIPADIQVAVRP